MLAYTRRRIDVETAYDLTAETFAIAWRRLDEPGLSSAITSAVGPLPWLYATARRVLANELRAERYRQQLSTRAVAAAAAGVPTIVDHAEAIGERDELRRALARLSPRDQEVVQLSTWEDLDPAAGALVIGCSTNVFTVRLHRARRRLRAALEAERRDPPPSARAASRAPSPSAAPTQVGAPRLNRDADVDVGVQPAATTTAVSAPAATSRAAHPAHPAHHCVQQENPR